MSFDEPRFAFGDNWRDFLSALDRTRIAEAERSLRDLLALETLEGRSFLDIGCGSGLFSLAARRLGARVHSFDFDAASAACATELKRRYCDGDPLWTVAEGSILDPGFVAGLGRFDVVYSWGVLHHTGDMWRALDLAATTVAPGGRLFVALYNDLGWQSRVWRRLKRWYCTGPLGKAAVLSVGMPYLAMRGVVAGVATQGHPLAYFRSYASQRGMSVVHDWKDWLGGYPYEVATPDRVFAAVQRRGFVLDNLRTVRGNGCNQFVFRRSHE